MTPEGGRIIPTMRNDKGASENHQFRGGDRPSVTMPDREAAWPTWCWVSIPKAISSTGAASGKSVGRCANRIAFGPHDRRGKEYALEVNNGPNHRTAARRTSPTASGSRVRSTAWSCRPSEDGDQNYSANERRGLISMKTRRNNHSPDGQTTQVNHHVYFNLAARQRSVLRPSAAPNSPWCSK